ncbi:NAD(P)-dependent oxidoreductase [Chitinimonas sp. BJB300]|uniref:NAD(P)-dependent oxidoreductase n=1 Tax=Chitinimonas sp. BJB300 TaxID=1559339 RepID=UPI000C0CC319|nr:NAD(P)H-binding protein [Chitinimonas sp. BJB300]PHV12164.1 3-beta hydroxysteroid dehydrogenase [Chitinimonas sp. BJB300]TSJ90104.1 NAD-dependent epimerase/dehydratase family protein [Chitinimonas sp. BJB300]
MKIALIGATGFVGSALLNEALERGHHVTALSRNPDKLAKHTHLKTVPADVYNTKEVAAAVANADVVISAFNPGWDKADIQALFLKGQNAIVAGVKTAGVKRFISVGGAGSLYIAPGLQLVDTAEFPAVWKEGALGAREALNQIKLESSLDWTFVSPPVGLAPGAKSGKYRLGTDDVLFEGDQPAGISTADLAVAILDEVESPRHIQRRFTAASQK